MAIRVDMRPAKETFRPVRRTWPAKAGLGRLRKIACLGGAATIQYTPWHDPTWELWAHHSCRRACHREPDLFFDLHPPELWRDPVKKYWDKGYLAWLAQNRTPIYMQAVYPEAPASLRYPIETIVTEFARGYFTNTVSYMIALALMEGVTHLGIFGCNYDAASEYGPQRGCAEYWLGLAEGRGVHVCLPPHCDLLNRPALLYGYESHPNGRRDKSYEFGVGVYPKTSTGERSRRVPVADSGHDLIAASAENAPPLRDIGVEPALHRREGELTGR